MEANNPDYTMRNETLSVSLLVICFHLCGCDQKRPVSDAELRHAAESGDTNVLAVYSASGGDLNRLLRLRTKPPVCESLLHLAIGKGQPATVDWLLNHGADANVTNWEGRTPLMSSVLVRQDEVDESIMLKSFLALLNHGARMSPRDAEGNTALTYAVWYGHFPMVKLLLKNGADVNVTNTIGLTALHRVKDDQIAQLLLQAGANTRLLTISGESAVDWATKEHRWGVLNMLTNTAGNGQNNSGEFPQRGVGP